MKFNKDRAEYLNELSKEYGIDIYTVQALAEVMGEEEDYDGLIVVLAYIN